ncbi:hypothetical protein J2T13_002375 [Paenibacillus sp. DS2015]|uniref:hypothetical protein n=1 Tax=Paenibacillus sp. DS2015 TaxID=3373917 RepID=UPI003D241FB0
MAYPFIIEPSTYHAFEDEAAQIEQCKEWSLLSEKASKNKPFFYKGNGLNLACTIIGYVDNITAVIQFDNNQLHCIHPSYLKEMQTGNYGQRVSAAGEQAMESESVESVESEEPKTLVNPQEEAPIVKAKPAEPKAKKSKTSPKLQLPEEKVKMIAKVQEFTTVPNHFSDNEDEVVIYEAIRIIAEPEIEVGTAWSSHSATIKKMELQIGDTITFEAKIVAKKLTKHPVPYKINNPAKIQKEEA